jgi:Ca2+-binding RTX toxin-like protein
MWGRETSRRKRRWRALLFGCGLVLASAGTAYGIHFGIDTEAHTTLEQILQGDGPNFETLSVEQVNEDYLVREPDPQAQAQVDREDRRVSLAYVAQLTDFQLADEESPARVEFADPGASSAWRPQEAFHPFLIDASIRQINRFVLSSPVPQGNGASNRMDFALMTGDQADNNQRNEMIWTRKLIEGGASNATDFGSGVEDPSFYNPMNSAFSSKPSCLAFLAQEGGSAANAAAEAAGYTGVQDVDDYPAAAPPPQPAYYDPDVDPTMGPFADFPVYSGLMDRAQTLSFTPAGLGVPSYWSNGNHDVLVQGNEDANAAFEDIATACFKALGTTQALPPSSPGPDFSPDPNLLLFPASVGMLVPPDPLRRFVDRPQIKAVIGANNVDNDHGFDFVSAAENTASAGTASYYAWNPSQTPGFRFINVDTNSEGGQTAEGVASGSSNGNIDDPQFQWLTQELDAAQAADKLIVLFGHHPVRSMTTEIADEQATACTTNDSHGDTPEHDVNPGCDRDPRVSTPLHLGEDPVPGDPRESFVELLQNYPNVIAYVAGHTHEHRLIPFSRPNGSVWWEINTSATSDWPQQHRLIEVMDNQDGTLSIFGTVLDAASPAGIPPADPDGDDTGDFTVNDLSSIGRTLAFNDPDGGPPSGEGQPIDRNVEMLVGDPREADLTAPPSGGAPGVAGEGGGKCRGQAATITGTARAETITGTAGPDVIVGLRGADRINGGGGDDLICGGKGRDRIRGGQGDDFLHGGRGADRIKGKSGDDTLFGNFGKDRLKGNKGDDLCVGGRGRDLIAPSCE